MLRVRVCAAHMGWFLGPNFSKQGSLFQQIFHKHGNKGGFSRNWQKLSKVGSFLQEFIIKMGMMATVSN